MNDNTTFWSPDPSRLVVALQPGERVVVVGSAWLRCLAGACEVHGHALEAGAPRVQLHSTRALPPVSLRGVSPARATPRSSPRARAGCGAAKSAAVAELEAFDAADGLRSGARDAAQAWDDGAHLPRAARAAPRSASARTAAASGRLEPPRGPGAAAAAGRAPCGVVVGAKGAGKSTFCRQLLNGLGGGAAGARPAPRVADWRRLSVAYVGGAADFAPASAEAAATLPWSPSASLSADLPRPRRRRRRRARGGADGPGVWPPADWLQAAPCAGLALVTSAAAGAVRLWSPAASLDGCDVLLRGRLAPPVDLLYRGPARHGAFAFLSSESLDRDDLATAMKSRSNIGRKAHKADAAS
ncbi:polynucleotide 5'-hydroxyl-kinase [Aureococcus anophagefferens]|nr:polynucleotide 5'-hydroxyl-kinase [Aureococcus anophagefferens]